MAATASRRIGGNGRIGANDYAAEVAPTPDNDVRQGHQVGDHWLVTAKGIETVHVCFDNTAGDAVWRQVNLTAPATAAPTAPEPQKVVEPAK